MYREQDRCQQGTLWLPTHELPRPSAHSFYGRLHTQLEKMNFGGHVRKACAPFYDHSGTGRPGTDPEVFFRMLMVGFFEKLASERAIAARCDDSMQARAFLGYTLTEKTPDHSTLSRFRSRIPEAVFFSAFEQVLRALKESKLFRGQHLGIDASVIEANAALSSLIHRLTKESYQQYIRSLAKEAGVDPDDAEAVRTFDRGRKDKKTSNKEWQNPHDEDACIGRDKKGATRMLYKPEHAVDLETGAIADVRVRHGDEGDATDLFTRMGEAEERINRVLEREADAATVETATADKGYHKAEELAHLQHVGIETLIPSPQRKRNPEQRSEAEQRALLRAEVMTGCEAGKAFLKRRAGHVERSFRHMLDAGGLRRTTLRGRGNIEKRYVVGALCYNLSLLMRKLFGVGTLKQALASGWELLCAFVLLLDRRVEASRVLERLLERAVGLCRLRVTGKRLYFVR